MVKTNRGLAERFRFRSTQSTKNNRKYASKLHFTTNFRRPKAGLIHINVGISQKLSDYLEKQPSFFLNSIFVGDCKEYGSQLIDS